MGEYAFRGSAGRSLNPHDRIDSGKLRAISEHRLAELAFQRREPQHAQAIIPKHELDGRVAEGARAIVEENRSAIHI
jgi:hypothetical protein